jgi:hypothetical protein
MISELFTSGMKISEARHVESSKQHPSANKINDVKM